VLGAVAVIVAVAFGLGLEAPPEAEPVADDAPEVQAEAAVEATRAKATEPTPAETTETTPEEPRVEAMPQAQKRTRSKQRAKAQPGTINLVTRGGWAEIYEGKKSLGSTPRRLTLSSGRHKLVLKPFGTEKPKTVYVVVEAGKTKKVSIALD